MEGYLSWIWRWLHNSTHVIKWHRTTHTHDPTASFLLLILYMVISEQNISNHWGKLGEEDRGISLYYLASIYDPSYFKLKRKRQINNVFLERHFYIYHYIYYNYLRNQSNSVTPIFFWMVNLLHRKFIISQRDWENGRLEIRTSFLIFISSKCLPHMSKLRNVSKSSPQSCLEPEVVWWSLQCAYTTHVTKTGPLSCLGNACRPSPLASIARLMPPSFAIGETI